MNSCKDREGDYQSFPQVEGQGLYVHWSGQHGSKSLRKLCKRNLYTTADIPAKWGTSQKNRTRRVIPPKVTQSYGCNLAGQHPAMSSMSVVFALMGKGGHTELGWSSLADPIHCKPVPQAVTCRETCVHLSNAVDVPASTRGPHCHGCHPQATLTKGRSSSKSDGGLSAQVEEAVREGSPVTSTPSAPTSVPQYPLEKIRKHKYLHSARTRGRVPMSPLLAGNPWELHS